MKIFFSFLFFILSFSIAQEFEWGITKNMEVNRYHVVNLLLKYDAEPVSQHKFLSYHGEIYPSFPPAFFIFSYFAYCLTGKPTDKVLFLECLSVFLQILSAILLCRFLLLFKIGALTCFLCAMLYLSLPPVLHYGTVVYWAHHLWTPVFLLFLIALKKEKAPLVLLLAFLQCWIVWEGYLAVSGAMLYFASQKKYKMSLYLACASILAFEVNMLHFMTAMPASDYLLALVFRHGARSGGTCLQWLDFFYLEYGITCIFLLFLVGFSRKLLVDGWFLWLCFAPCLATFLILGHDLVYGFGRIKYAVPIVFATACYADAMKTRWKLSLFCLICVANFFIYIKIYQ